MGIRNLISTNPMLFASRDRQITLNYEEQLQSKILEQEAALERLVTLLREYEERFEDCYRTMEKYRKQIHELSEQLDAMDKGRDSDTSPESLN